jgi:hypothetical protein
MMISASRRTDIPAFYIDWFLSRLREGHVLTPNPLNPRQIRRIDLSPEAVDGFIFWSKNPAPMLGCLTFCLANYAYYFQFTLNAYGQTIESGVPDKEDAIMTFRRLSDLIGPDRIVWRYDPIILSDTMTLSWHLDHFNELAGQLESFTSDCTISFIDIYRKILRAMRHYDLRPPDPGQIRELAAGMVGICREHGIRLQTCAEAIDLSDLGIGHARCIDCDKMSAISGKPVKAGKDKNQRPACGCSVSADIGIYNTCRYGCIYCYANCSSALSDLSPPLTLK